jgi:ubiquinone/menaquinone biosynthesis C-methylase UbiE
MDGRIVAESYQDPGLKARVTAALRNLGLDDGPIPWEMIESLDQLHTRGLAATKELAAALNPERGSSVLDVGSGLGGSARYLAGKYGCVVSGIDLTRGFVDVANDLIQRTGQADSIRFAVGDALDLPFASESFDYAWTQHVAMNIHDRDRLYRGIQRVLKPGSRFAVHDIIAGSGAELRFPVPWAPVADLNHLVTEEEMRSLLDAAGFHERSWIDRTDATIAWLGEMNEIRAKASGPQLFGPSLIQGRAILPAFDNLEWNLKDGRARVIQAIFERD